MVDRDTLGFGQQLPPHLQPVPALQPHSLVIVITRQLAA